MNLYADFEYEIEQAVIQTREEVTEQVTENVTDRLVNRFVKYSIANNKSKDIIINELMSIFGVSFDEAERYYSDGQL